MVFENYNGVQEFNKSLTILCEKHKVLYEPCICEETKKGA